MNTFERDGVRVVLRPRTLLTDRTFLTMVRRTLVWFEDYAQENGHDINIVDSVLSDFLELSARTVSADGFDFEFAIGADKADILREKFERYIQTAHVQAVTDLLAHLRVMDAPFDLEKAPGAVVADPKDAKSGKKKSETTLSTVP